MCFLIEGRAASSLLHLLEGAGWKDVARLKSNRICGGSAVREQWPQRFGRGVGRLRQVKPEVLVVKDGRRYFVTNATLHDGRFIARLRTAYNERVVSEMQKRLRGTLRRERQGSTLKLRIRY